LKLLRVRRAPWSPLKGGDAAKVTGEAMLEMATDIGAELIVIDVPLRFAPVGVWAGER
jgi:hypothetical protein